MKTVTKQLKKITLLWMLCLGTNLVAQTVITIDNNPDSTAQFQTLQAAHDAAANGDTIYVQPSETSYGDVTIDKPLTIVGRSHSEIGNVSTVGDIIVRSSSVTVKGLSFNSFKPQTAGATAALPFTDVNVFECKTESIELGESNTSPETVMDSVNIRGNFLLQIELEAFTDATNVILSNNIMNGFDLKINAPSQIVISNNIFRFGGFINRDIYNFSTTETLLLFNNMFIGNFPSDYSIDLNNGSFNLSNNLTFNYGSGDVVFETNSGATFTEFNNLNNTDPLFTDTDATEGFSLAGNFTVYDPNAYPDDLTLQPTSSALTGGTGGTEIGLYGDGFLYNITGNPRGVPTLEVVSYQGAVPVNGTMEVTVKAKAH